MTSIKWKKNGRQNIYLTQITTYECKIHKFWALEWKQSSLPCGNMIMVQTDGQFDATRPMDNFTEIQRSSKVQKTTVSHNSNA